MAAYYRGTDDLELVTVPKTGEDYLVILLKPDVIQRMERESQYLVSEYRQMGGGAIPLTYTMIPVAKLRQPLDYSIGQYMTMEMLGEEFSVTLCDLTIQKSKIFCDTCYPQEFLDFCQNFLVRQRLVHPGELAMGKISKMCPKKAEDQYILVQNKPHQTTTLRFTLSELGVTDGVTTTTLFRAGSIVFWGLQRDDILTKLLIEVVNVANGTDAGKLKKVTRYLKEKIENLALDDDEDDDGGEDEKPEVVKHAQTIRGTPSKFKKLPENGGSEKRIGSDDTLLPVTNDTGTRSKVKIQHDGRKAGRLGSKAGELDLVDDDAGTHGHRLNKIFSDCNPEDQGKALAEMAQTFILNSASPELKTNFVSKLIGGLTDGLGAAKDEELARKLQEAEDQGYSKPNDDEFPPITKPKKLELESPMVPEPKANAPQLGGSSATLELRPSRGDQEEVEDDNDWESSDENYEYLPDNDDGERGPQNERTKLLDVVRTYKTTGKLNKSPSALTKSLNRVKQMSHTDYIGSLSRVKQNFGKRQAAGRRFEK